MKNKKHIIVIGHIFKDLHMTMQDTRIISGHVQYAQDAYRDEGGIATVYRAVEGAGLCRGHLNKTGIGYATIINQNTPIVYLEDWIAKDVINELMTNYNNGELDHIHIAYANLISSDIRHALHKCIETLNGVTVSADIAPHSGGFNFDTWYDIVDIWIAHAVDLLGIDYKKAHMVIAHSATGSITYVDEKIIFQSEAPDINEDEVANTTGAGDIFAGIFLSYFLMGKGIEYSIKIAHCYATNAVKSRYNAGNFRTIQL